jgi:hypothetical protein
MKKIDPLVQSALVNLELISPLTCNFYIYEYLDIPQTPAQRAGFAEYQAIDVKFYKDKESDDSDNAHLSLGIVALTNPRKKKRTPPPTTPDFSM